MFEAGYTYDSTTVIFVVRAVDGNILLLFLIIVVLQALIKHALCHVFQSIVLYRLFVFSRPFLTAFKRLFVTSGTVAHTACGCGGNTGEVTLC